MKIHEFRPTCIKPMPTYNKNQKAWNLVYCTINFATSELNNPNKINSYGN